MTPKNNYIDTIEVGLTGNNKAYTRNPDFIFRKIVEEMILVPIVHDTADMDCVYALNELGATVWSLLEAPRAHQDLREAILSEYDAEPEAVSADLDSFLSDMLEIGAIQEVDA